uniref:Ribosomal protein S21 n=1 Tax=Picea sitchensis TaxID=3332 RepID=A9NVI2_PICSI|nr:unknown [Picea sitchensis]ABR16898.1 unknown [Picea sitchensis]ACN40545.1 unknown [Picea sitchensis]
MASAAMALGLGLRCAMPQRENGNRISLLSNTAGRQKAVVGVKELVMNPSFEYANVMWFKGKHYNAQVFVGEDEPADAVVRRFRKAVMDAGVISECKRRRFFESPQDVAKRKTEASRARKLRNKRIIQAKAFRKENEKKEIVENDEEDDDYWGGPDDGALPF